MAPTIRKIQFKIQRERYKWLQSEAIKIEPDIKDHANFKNPQRLLKF